VWHTPGPCWDATAPYLDQPSGSVSSYSVRGLNGYLPYYATPGSFIDVTVCP
jgi:hypothetical protein